MLLHDFIELMNYFFVSLGLLFEMVHRVIVVQPQKKTRGASTCLLNIARARLHRLMRDGVFVVDVGLHTPFNEVVAILTFPRAAGLNMDGLTAWSVTFARTY